MYQESENITGHALQIQTSTSAEGSRNFASRAMMRLDDEFWRQGVTVVGTWQKLWYIVVPEI